jgi:Fe2+ transport system protein FeoA
MNYLSELPLNEKGIIKRIHINNAVKERLHSFGLIRGVEVVPVRNSPLGCPRIYRCLGTKVAIRNNIAKKVEII